MENLNGQHTFLECADAMGKPISTVQKSYVRKFGTGFDRYSKPTPAQYLSIFGGQTDVRTEVRTTDNGHADTKQTTVADTPTIEKTTERTGRGTDWSGLFFRSVCALIIIGHAVLIAYDCWTLWGIPGGIAGIIALLTVVGCMVLSADERQKKVSEQMIWFVWLIDAAAGFVHYPTFWNKASVGYAMGIREFETACLSFFVCLCSMAALYFFRASKIQNNEK